MTNPAAATVLGFVGGGESQLSIELSPCGVAFARKLFELRPGKHREVSPSCAYEPLTLHLLRGESDTRAIGAEQGCDQIMGGADSRR